MLSTYQGIQNQQVQNKLYQQDLLNKQQELQNLELTNRTGELANTKTLQGMAAGVSWMLHTDPNLTYQRAMDGINGAEQMGYPSSQLEKVRSMITPDMPPDAMRELFGRIALNSVAANDPEKAQRMMNPATGTLTSGQVTYPTLIPQVGDMQGRTPGVPILAWPQNQGIGAPSGVQQLPAPQWQSGVTSGGEGVQAPSPNLGPFGKPIILPSSGGSGGTGPAGAPAPGGAFSSGGLVRTTLSPEETESNALSAVKMQTELYFDSGYAQANQQNLAALQALRNADVGAGSTERNWAKSFVLSVAGPDYAKRLGIDEGKINWFDEANKYLTARQNALSGPAATDFGREQQKLSNPNVEISKNAAIQMHMINTGFDNMREAAIKTYMAQHPGADINDPNVSAGFTRYWNGYMNSHDYRAFMPQNRNERSATIDGLQPTETDTYGASLKDANSIGVKVTP